MTLNNYIDLYAKLAKTMRTTADTLSGQHPLDVNIPNAISGLRMGANAIEELLKEREERQQ